MSVFQEVHTISHTLCHYEILGCETWPNRLIDLQLYTVFNTVESASKASCTAGPLYVKDLVVLYHPESKSNQIIIQ